jgi:hypothetical protein
MRRSVALATLALSLALPALAADPAMDGPPKVMVMEWESLKPGSSAAHDKVAAGFAALAVRMKSRGYWIGLNPISGDGNLALFLGGYPSFAAAEAAHGAEEAAVAGSPALRSEMDRLEKAGAALHTSQKSVWATYQEELSYRAPGPADIGKARFMEVIVTRVRPGRIPDYVEFLKAANQGREKANVPARLAVFQVASGAPTGTFVIFHPMVTLAELDQDFQKAFVSALGEENWKKLRLSYAEIVEENTRTVFAINPKISYPYPPISAADPAFWSPKGKGAPAP